MAPAILAEPIPIRPDAAGVLCVGGTRVTLTTVVQAQLDGFSAGEIAHRYDSLSLADVHAALAYYLRHKIELDVYCDEQRESAQAIREEVTRRQGPQVTRAELTARLNAQTGGE